MKTIIIYYSLSGNTRCIAQILADALDGELCALTTKRAYPRQRWLQMVLCGASAVLKLTPKLNNAFVDIKAYDNVVLGAPVWAGTCAAPMTAFLKTCDLRDKSVALFACHGGGGAEKFMKHIKAALAGSRLVGQSEYCEPLRRDKEDQQEKAKEWAKQLAL